MSAIRPRQTFENSPHSNGFIAKLLRMAGSAAAVSRVSYTSDSLPGLIWGIVDTGTEPVSWQSCGDEVIHILHAENEPVVRVTVDGNAMSILPGDSLYIGANSVIGLSHGVLALRVHSDLGSSVNGNWPSHGLEQYDGFNRQTMSASGPQIFLDRWKLTVPYLFAIDRPAAFIVLFGDISFIDLGSIETLGPGESVVYVDAHVRVIPDGLAYVAIIRQPSK